MRRIVSLALAGFLVVTVAACSGGGSSSSGGNFCDTAKSASENGDKFSVAFDNNDTKKLDQLETIIKDLQSKAPSEIKDDMKVLVDFFGKYVQAVKDAKGDQTKLIAALSSFAGDTSKIETASKNIDDYMKKNCGFTLDGSDSSTDSSSSSKSSDSSSDFSFNSDSVNSALSSLASQFSDLSDLSNLSNFSNN